MGELVGKVLVGRLLTDGVSAWRVRGACRTAETAPTHTLVVDTETDPDRVPPGLARSDAAPAAGSVRVVGAPEPRPGPSRWERLLAED